MNINLNSLVTTLAVKAKALALNVTEIELKVMEATNEEPWGPHGKDMQGMEPFTARLQRRVALSGCIHTVGRIGRRDRACGRGPRQV